MRLAPPCKNSLSRQGDQTFRESLRAQILNLVAFPNMADKGPSIYDVRTEGGMAVRELADFADEQY